MKDFWDSTDYIRVLLQDVEVEARVGMHPWENHPERPTRLIVNVELFAHLLPAPKETPFINYDIIRDAMRSWRNRAHTPLLETLAEEVIALAFSIENVEACRISIVKPDIFNEAKAAGVEIFRRKPGS